MKKHFLFLLSLLSISCFAANTNSHQPMASCPQSVPTNQSNFCSSFRESAICHCVSMGLPRAACQDMHMLYERMVSMFGTVERACAYQKDTSKQVCLDDWSCYMKGGEDSQGRACSSTGYACE